MHVISSFPKFELRIAQEIRAYKIWDLVYKIVQNKYKIMIYFSLSKSVLGGPVTCTSANASFKKQKFKFIGFWYRGEVSH